MNCKKLPTNKGPRSARACYRPKRFAKVIKPRFQVKKKKGDHFPELSESDLNENKLGDQMTKQLLNSVIAKYRDSVLSFASDKLRYIA